MKTENTKDETYCRINRVELQSNLAHNSAMDEMINNQSINDEDEMYVDAESDMLEYTEKAQDVFNRWYDYYYDEINKAIEE